MKRLMFPVLMSALILAALFGPGAAAADIEAIDKSKRESIIEKDRLRRERIIKKFNDFAEKVKQRSPGFAIKLPVNPDRARDIADQSKESRTRTARTYAAYAGEPYRLRSRPSDSDSNYIEKVKRGDRLMVVFTERLKQERKNITRDWCMVRTPSGKEGYIPLNLLSKSPAAARKRLSHGGKAEGTPLYGRTASVVFGGFLVEPAALPRASEKPSRVYVVDVSTTLNIRSSPGQDAPVLGELRRGEIVEIIEYGAEAVTIDGLTAKWARIQSGGIEGWVFSGYLKKAKIEEAEDPAELKTGTSLYVKSALLRVRDEPGDEGTVITSIPHQKQVRITEVVDELQSVGRIRSKWVRIQYEEFSGWVFGGFLSRDRDAFLDNDDIDFQFIFPVDGYYRISSPFGYRVNPIGANKGKQEFHPGIDIAAPSGTPILAAADGFVILAQEDNSGYGIYVILEHRNGNRSLYGHMSKMKAVTGQKVKTGEIIGFVGSTGRSTGPHLHFEIIMNSQYVNPEQYMHALRSGYVPGEMAALEVRRILRIARA